MTIHTLAKRLEMTLEDRLNQEEGWVYMTGMQALVRLPIQQRKRDMAAGMNTGGYISGYRGSPMGTYDMNLWRAARELKDNNIHFQPGLNEDLAATAVWGAQHVGSFPGAKVDGVFSIWYGKSPGLDRSMDPLRHANLAGTNPKGGTLLLVGDDHGAKSSSVACYSDSNFASIGAPLLAPANAQDVLDFGLHGIALSRYASTLTGIKLVTDVVEGGGSVYVAPDSPRIIVPEDEGQEISIRPGLVPVAEQERILWDIKLRKALKYVRANGLNRIHGSDDAKIGVIAAGKAWQDVNQALADLNYADGKIGNVPVRLLKIGLVWPLDDAIVREFAKGLDTIIVVEEKRPLLENQIRTVLYGTELAPNIVGKTFSGHAYSAEAAECAFPNHGEINPNLVSSVIVRVASETHPDCAIAMPNQPKAPPLLGQGSIRPPSFCAGCPHGRSTQVVSGSRALAGIGCHTMAVLRDQSKTNSICQMGGEGALWLGQFHFTEEKHVFANMGDGTYFHSGLLAIRAAIAANATITYKLLYNGFVSMTGGQPIDGSINPEQMIAQLTAEGVRRIALVADEPEKYSGKSLGPIVTIHARSELELAQRKMREIEGVTVVIYDQPCATERRRLRKRGKWADPDMRAYINPEVCEGCGHCSTVSACMAIEPLETELGRKRKINQSSCNKDFSCVEGFCPAFVTVSGVGLRSSKTADTGFDVSHIPFPELPPIDGSWSILASGIGGAGVVTLGQTLAVAAHADGYYASNLDITGLAQKYGAVHSHIKIALTPNDMRATRIASAEADGLIGCDLVVAAGDEALSKLIPGHSVAITDTTVVPTAEFSRNPDWRLSASEQFDRLTRVLGEKAHAIRAQDIAERVMGDRVFANFVLMGASWQQGGIPLSLEAIHRAIELNGVGIDENKQAFDLGRLAFADPEGVERLLGEAASASQDAAQTTGVEDFAARRCTDLTAYKDATYASRYSSQVRRVQAAGMGYEATMAVARGLYKLLAVKDEWEVARLYSKPSFREGLADVFDGEMTLEFHFGAWPYGGIDKKTGKAVKGAVGGKTAMRLFAIMNRLRFLRGTVADPFRNNDEAKLARKLLADYEADIEFALTNWSKANTTLVAELLGLPDQIRGFGHVRERHAKAVALKRQEIRAAIVNTGSPSPS